MLIAHSLKGQITRLVRIPPKLIDLNSLKSQSTIIFSFEDYQVSELYDFGLAQCQVSSSLTLISVNEYMLAQRLCIILQNKILQIYVIPGYQNQSNTNLRCQINQPSNYTQFNASTYLKCNLKHTIYQHLNMELLKTIQNP